MTIGITTPRGQVGSQIVKRLLQQNKHNVILLDHKPEQSEEIYGANVTIKQCDIKDPNSLIEATKEIDMLYAVVPPNNGSETYFIDFVEVGKNYRKAVEINGIGHVVFQSSYGAQLPYGTGPIVGLYHVEQELKRTNANVVNLRACYFMENFLWFKHPIGEKGIIPLPVKKESKTIYNSTKDIASRAIKWLSTDTWAGKIVDEIHGEELSFEEVANLISQKVSKEVSVFELTDEQSIESYTQPHIGFSLHYSKMFNELHRGIDEGILIAEYLPNKASKTTISFQEFVVQNF